MTSTSLFLPQEGYWQLPPGHNGRRRRRIADQTAWQERWRDSLATLATSVTTEPGGAVPADADTLVVVAPPHLLPSGLDRPTILVTTTEYPDLVDSGLDLSRLESYAAVLTPTPAATAAFGAFVPEERLGAAPTPRERLPRTEELVVDGVVIDSQHHSPQADPEAPVPAVTDDTHRLAFDGIVYLANFDPDDPSEHWDDVLSAFVYALRDRTDATLLVQLPAGRPERSLVHVWDRMKRLSPYSSRIIVVVPRLAALLRTPQANCVAVTASGAEAEPSWLLDHMAAEVPVIGPVHSALADRITIDSGYPVASTLLPAPYHWDKLMRLRTRSHRCDWQSLADAFTDSYYDHHHHPDRMREKGRAAARKAVAGTGPVLEFIATAGASLPMHRNRAGTGRS